MRSTARLRHRQRGQATTETALIIAFVVVVVAVGALVVIAPLVMHLLGGVLPGLRP